MAGIDNRHIIRETLNKWKANVIEPEMEKKCVVFCNTICGVAIQYRLSHPEAHNFTGNLLNSIVVCLYKKGSPIYACYAAGSLRKAIQVKMTYPKKYVFKNDYDGAEGVYFPNIETNEGWGEDDAREFFHSYKPRGNDLFNIVVAYSTEYAEWVEIWRGTTGFVGTYDFVKKNGLRLLSIQYGEIPF